MLKIIEEHISAISKKKFANQEDAEKFRVKFLGKKGVLSSLFLEFKTLDSKEKKTIGAALNELKTAAEDALKSAPRNIKKNKNEGLEDLSRPGYNSHPGSRHPISIVKNEIIEIFENLGFTSEEGPEMEDDWHNFSALNFPEEHPARDMQDTFFLTRDQKWALRTHTSSVQVRTMEAQTPPIRIIAPGRVFRNEAISSRSHCVFHQVEGLYIDSRVSFADMKQTLSSFSKAFFGEATQIRLRPSYFPFTEPSAEMDIWWGLENEVDHRMTKGTGWLEIMGCGMVDPNVLDSCGIDSQKYSGFAFGMGIERIAMQRFQIPDIRAFYENDIRFLKNFTGA
ncbi:MAG: phenylalanine--tRNA ligase subunit alpha [Cryomorphaceae bacterium]|nr:phenylalanine--tRNA ligase subunit alpha [Cryomorphaceae bacterium]